MVQYLWYISNGSTPGALSKHRLLERTQPGHFVESPCFAFAGLDGLQLRLYPKGELCQAFFNSLIQEVRCLMMFDEFWWCFPSFLAAVDVFDVFGMCQSMSKRFRARQALQGTEIPSCGLFLNCPEPCRLSGTMYIGRIQQELNFCWTQCTIFCTARFSKIARKRFLELSERIWEVLNMSSFFTFHFLDF